MTEPSVYKDDVSKLKDDEVKQAYVGLKDTNRYFLTATSLPHLHVFTHCPPLAHINLCTL